MNTGGWIFMLVTWSIIIGMMIYCYARVMRSEEDEYSEQYKIDN